MNDKMDQLENKIEILINQNENENIWKLSLQKESPITFITNGYSKF